ncbi:MAG: KamA family radical SAM protein [Magnetococcales bacterium]|nr:KamA family radical SAM protein [Magnetococcales bacterium]
MVPNGKSSPDALKKRSQFKSKHPLAGKEHDSKPAKQDTSQTKSEKKNAHLIDSINDFPKKIPPLFRSRMGQVPDGLIALEQQYEPQKEEQEIHPDFVQDPLEEEQCHSASPLLLQKYRGRALMLAGRTCPIHCRFCFRRHRPTLSKEQHEESLEYALDAIETDTSLREVILSGGDPLTLDDSTLGLVVQRLSALAHLERIRVHTRVPIVTPERITHSLLDNLCNSRLPTVIVLHTNHPSELDTAASQAIKALRERGVLLLHQGVLLRGLNDSAEVLNTLFKRLISLGVTPYYLHLLDPVAGSAHFSVPDEDGITLIHRLRQLLPGYMVPRLAREIPGKQSKTILA